MATEKIEEQINNLIIELSSILPEAKKIDDNLHGKKISGVRTRKKLSECSKKINEIRKQILSLRSE